MSDKSQKSKSFSITVFICIIVGIIIFYFSVGAVRTWLADRKALSYAKETGIIDNLIAR